MARKFIILVVCLLPFALYHTNTGRGPDSSIYLEVAHRIVSEGHLNILPRHLSVDTIWQITPSKHAPIHQNIGGVFFFLPATAFAFVSLKLASFIPHLPPQLYDINYHERLWVGGTAYILALFFCLLTYQVGRRYFPAPAVLAAVLSCLYGGPLLIYAAVFPCQMNLPAAFLSALLLYIYHFSNLEKKLSWLLLGAVWGLGVFVRAEFVVWGLLLLYGLIVSRPLGRGGWRWLLGRVFMAACGGLLFIVPGVMVRQAIFGTQGSTYGVQFDLEFLKSAYLMLVGARNGLFTFWPVLFIAMWGYLVRCRRNPPLYNVLAAILFVECIICGSTNFWSGEFGNSFGQRRFLVVLPCFILFLARLFDLCRRYFFWLAAGCAVSAVWALAMYRVYGEIWSFPDNSMGFLMPHHYSFLFSALSTVAARLPKDILWLIFLPKHADMLWMLPCFVIVGPGAFFLAQPFFRRQFTFCLVIMVSLACGVTVFLAGARQRGEDAFNGIVRANPQARFVTRNYEINDEMIGSMVDSVSFFMELHQEETAEYFKDKAMRFLAVEAPEQGANFKQMVEALKLRQVMGWYRLVPEQSHCALLEWYRMALLYKQNGQDPPDISGQFLY